MSEPRLIATGHQAGAGGRAVRAGDVAIGAANAGLGERVEIRRWNILAALETLVGIAHVVADDEDDVGLFGVSSGENGTERSKGSKEQKAEEHWNGPWVGRLVGCVAT